MGNIVRGMVLSNESVQYMFFGYFRRGSSPRLGMRIAKLLTRTLVRNLAGTSVQFAFNHIGLPTYCTSRGYYAYLM